MRSHRSLPDEPGSARIERHSPEVLQLESRDDRVVVVSVEDQVPEDVWVGVFTRDRPELLVEFRSLLAVRRRRSLTDIDIQGPAVDWTKEIAGFPDVVEVHLLGLSPMAGRYRVLFREAPLVATLIKLEIIVQYPATVQRGVIRFEAIDRASRIRQLVAKLRASGRDARLVSVREESLLSRRPILTPVQRALFRRALASGYFAVPRRISLTRLAAEISKSKSTVSRTLAIVEQKLLEAAYKAMG